jgi:hypothetical protein
MTGLRVESYGTGTQVRLPGRTAMGKSELSVVVLAWLGTSISRQHEVEHETFATVM